VLNPWGMKAGRKRLLILFSLLVFSAVLAIVAIVLVHLQDSSFVAKASKLRTGMSRDEVLQIMGKPSVTNIFANTYVVWAYNAPPKFRFDLRPYPFRVSLWEKKYIKIFFDDQKVKAVMQPK